MVMSDQELRALYRADQAERANHPAAGTPRYEGLMPPMELAPPWLRDAIVRWRAEEAAAAHAARAGRWP